MLKFISFGSGSSGNCYYLYTEDYGLMIDLGVGVRALKKYFKDFGLAFSDIQAVLVTHDHADHVKCVGSMSHEYALPVYTTGLVHTGINKNYCVRYKIGAECVHAIEKGVSFSLGDFKVTPFGVPHDSTDNVGYKIEYNGTVFCIMTDVGHVTEEMKAFISEANYLVIEANHDEEMLRNGNYPQYLKERISGGNGHLCNNACAVAIAENATTALKHVWLCHLSEENNHPELARKTVEQVLRSYGIVAGKDFEMDVLKRKSPSGAYELV
ncbi:MAG: MBL fold metallo-hydrolase [Prevotella sp.]